MTDEFNIPIIPASMDNEPATTDLTLYDMQRHLDETVIIECEEPALPLSQGSWLRASRRNISATIRVIMSVAPSNVKLRVRDGKTAASCRRLTPEQRALFMERDERLATMTGPE